MTGLVIFLFVIFAACCLSVAMKERAPAPRVRVGYVDRDSRGRFVQKKSRSSRSTRQETHFHVQPHSSYKGDPYDEFPHLAPAYPDGIPSGDGRKLYLGPQTKLNAEGEVVWIKTWNEKNYGHP